MPIELVDLPIELLLAERQRDDDDAVASARANRGGSNAVRKVCDLLDADEDRQPLEDHFAVRGARRPHREQPRREQVALARGFEPRTVEQIDVLTDRASDEHHQRIVDGRQRRRAALLQRGVVLDEALRDRRGLRRGVFEIGLRLARKVRADAEREERHRDDGACDIRQKQLPIEARAKFPQQLASARRRERRQQREERGAREQQDVQHGDQHHQLGEVDEVPEPR
ncbi:MAG TPA: hypothetical protein VFF43_18610, partial [Caldimonas sp.]|nr:hypothetical protein [Caldimonas sp.]